MKYELWCALCGKRTDDVNNPHPIGHKPLIVKEQDTTAHHYVKVPRKRQETPDTVERALRSMGISR